MKKILLLPLFLVSLNSFASTDLNFKDQNLLSKVENKSQNKSGNQEETFTNGFQLGYLSGMVAGVTSVIANKSYGICLDPNTTDETVLKTVVSYIKNNPDKTEMKAPVLIGMALKDKWPCSNT